MLIEEHMGPVKIASSVYRNWSPGVSKAKNNFLNMVVEAETSSAHRACWEEH